MTSSDSPTYLADYAPPAWLVRDVHLTFHLHPTKTLVQSRIRFEPNPEVDDRKFQLHGEGPILRWARIDGQDWKPHIRDGLLTAKVPDGSFVWEAEVEINPSANTELEGLYMSNGIYCTQCEAEGFRKITFYPDRPDVLAPFTVRIVSGEPFRLSNGTLQPGDGPHPVLLSNGNPGASGEGFAEWHDPWPKPAYLFALVAGDLCAVSDRFTTRSGREVELNIWVRPGDEGRCHYALDALKRAMAWDEDVYGREYDLDVFNIVAVDDFNAGAMENKGLNIFNSAYILASPETATDRDYEMIESVVAHEYFHNWTGNRITCRDWFQLCLKEGLTVYRDQQFTGDQRSHAVKRIEDVLALRAHQFREDNGPLSHPVRPESFIEINNFYTSTVYEKGAEVIGMLKHLVGDDAYATALDLYFERHDGEAATVEDWLKVFEDSTGRDLKQFKRWYEQSGTPRVRVHEDYRDGTYTLTLKQHTPPTSGQPDKAPQVIPVAVGLLDAAGEEVLATTVLEFGEEERSFAFEGLAARPIPSLLRNFSAPVILEHERTAEERAFLLAHDTDPFNKWEAGRQLAKDVLTRMITDGAAPGPAYLDALEMVARDDRLDPAFRALALHLPSEDDMAQSLHDAGRTPDPAEIHLARERMGKAMAARLEQILPGLYEDMNLPGPYSPDPKAAGCRALRLTALGLITRIDDGKLARRQFDAADNMTEELGALACLIRAGAGDEALASFYRRWSHDRLVTDKWFSLQVAEARPSNAARVAEALTAHPDFDWKNPNRFRSVFGGLARNTAGFHAPGGRSYVLLADWLIRLDPVNPQTAARMTTIFETWKRYDADRQGIMREQLERIGNAQGVSRDTGEIVSRILNG